jgi:hypothetical protein
MIAKEIYFERTKSLPGYNNIKVGIKILVEKDEKAFEVFKKAELFVANALNESPTPQQMEMALSMVQNKKDLDDLPF